MAALDLVEVARTSGLRHFLHGVNATIARELLAAFVAELDRRTISERATWTPVAKLPDSDVTLQLYDPEASEPVWPGYFDGERWRYIDGMPATPTHYADMLHGPAPRIHGNEPVLLVMDENQEWLARARRAAGTI
jgi:hypothetical protein